MDIYLHFDYTVLSCVEHLKKPDPAFYRIALARADAQPDEAIFIDDREEPVAAAEQMGIKGILYHYPENDALVRELKASGVEI